MIDVKEIVSQQMGYIFAVRLIWGALYILKEEKQMKKNIKKIISVLMIVVMCLTMAPLQGFVGLDISSWFTSEAKAAGISDSDGETYWAMSHEEAINFIGFMYDKSKVTEDMMNAGGVYKFLTGGFEKGTIEEYCAKLAFMETAKNNLSNCLASYNQMADSAYQFLRDYFEDQLTAGSIAESAAWDIADEIVDYCDEIVQAYSEGSHSISSECLSLKNAYSNVSTAFEVIEALIVGLGGLNYAWSSSKKDMYTYVSSYISNRSLKNSCSEAFDLINDYNKFALTDGFDYDFILDWASDDHIATLESFGDYIYFVSKSFNYNGSVFEPTDDLSEYKVIDVQCPTDVYVYNKDGELLLSIVDNEILNSSANISASVYDNKKRVALPLSCEYDVVIKGTDEGVMDYYIYEVFNDSIMRTVEHNAIPLTEGCTYTTTIPVEVYTDVENYNITSETGEEIEADYDSLPPVEDNIVDVIVAEELFDGFPIEIIDLVANTIFNMESVVDLSSYDISTDDAVALFSAIAKYYPTEYSLMANSDFTYKIIVSPNLDRIMKIRFYYGDDSNLSDYQKRVNDLNAEIDALVAQVEGMEDFEKALYIHDYIVLNCEYDLELLEYLETNGTLTGEMRSERYTEYSVLVNGTGICGSYALAYRAILNAAGMECLYLSSAQMNHAWNMVKIDGKWYHVDCCWDDPVPDTYGQARRTYFLRTDKEIMDLNHYSWTPGQYKATSEDYSDMPRNYDIKQKYDETSDSWYYLKGSTLYSSDKYGENITELGSISASSIDYDYGTLYFSKGRYVYAYNPETTESACVYLLSKADSGDDINKAYISNVYVDGENVAYYKSVYNNDESKSKILYDEDLLQKDKYESITGVEFKSSSIELNIFDVSVAAANITGNVNNLDDELTILYTSSDNNIVSIDESGNIKALNVGTATITASVLNYTATCTITVIGDGLSGSCSSNIIWDFDSNTKTLTVSGEGSMPNYSREGFPWYHIKDEIVKIVVDEGITSIGSRAMYECENVKDVYLASTVKTISAYSFYECYSLESINLQGVTSIGSYSFYNCLSLKEIHLPETLTQINDNAFYRCYKLKEITIPSSVTSIGKAVFKECLGLEKITVDEDNIYYCSDENGTLFNKNITTLIAYPPANQAVEYCVPNSVTTIDCSAFKCCSFLETITIPDSVTVISSTAFSDCSKLDNIIIPAGVTTISHTTFKNCRSLKNITFLGKINSIERSAFEGCVSLKEFAIPDMVTVINDYTFYGCTALEKIEMHNSITAIGISAFHNCENLLVIDMPNSLITIGEHALTNCKKLKSIKFASSITSLGDHVLYGCDSLNELEILNSSCSIVDILDNYSVITYGLSNSTIESYSLANDLVFVAIDSTEHVHDYVAKEINPTCCVEGYTEHRCDVCGDVISNNYKQALGHTDGNKDSKCDLCSLDLGEIKTYGDNMYYIKYVVTPKNKWQNGEANSWFFVNSVDSNGAQYQNEYKQERFFWNNTVGVPITVFEGWITGIPISITEYASKSRDSATPFTYSEGVFYFGTSEDDLQPLLDEVSFYATRENSTNPVGCYMTKELKHTHSLFLSDSVDTTHLLDGYKEYSCECGLVYHKVEEAEGHHYTEKIIIEPSCTQRGIKEYTCSVCGDTYTKEGKEEEGHAYEKTVVVPTCTEKGYTKEICTVCSETLLSDFTSPLGHEFIINRSADYCSAHGTFEYSCKNCDYKEYATSDASNLVTETITVEPTCTKSGSITEICTLCKAAISTEITNPLSHDYSDEWTVDVEPACTENGSKSKHCTRCDAKRLVTSIDSTGHTDTKFINVTEASCTKEGYTGDTYCNVCNTMVVNGESINKIAHTYSSTVTAPTCTAKGYTTHTCSNCGDSYTDAEKAVLGHKDDNNDGSCDNCGTKHSPSSKCSCMCHKSGFMGFVWKIVRFFWKLFKMNPVCDCGVAHY